MSYKSIYKCRLCGEKFPYMEIPDKSAFSVAVEMSMCGSWKAKNSTMVLFEQTPHICKDGSYGIGDFIGIKKSEVGK